jgi:DNA-directed RNA polymerase subunit RPC12/RpoP
VIRTACAECGVEIVAEDAHPEQVVRCPQGHYVRLIEVNDVWYTKVTRKMVVLVAILVEALNLRT